MVKLAFIEFLSDWTYFNIGFSLITITYPQKEIFRSDSFFAIEYSREAGFYMELFFTTIIGEKIIDV